MIMLIVKSTKGNDRELARRLQSVIERGHDTRTHLYGYEVEVNAVVVSPQLRRQTRRLG